VNGPALIVKARELDRVGSGGIMAEQIEWLDSEQAAQLLQVSPRTLVRWAREKKYPPRHLAARLEEYGDFAGRIFRV